MCVWLDMTIREQSVELRMEGVGLAGMLEDQMIRGGLLEWLESESARKEKKPSPFFFLIFSCFVGLAGKAIDSLFF